MHGTQQSLGRLAERGGFGWFEFLGMHRVFRWMKALEATGRRYTGRQLYQLQDLAFKELREGDYQ